MISSRVSMAAGFPKCCTSAFGFMAIVKLSVVITVDLVLSKLSIHMGQKMGKGQGLHGWGAIKKIPGPKVCPGSAKPKKDLCLTLFFGLNGIVNCKSPIRNSLWIGLIDGFQQVSANFKRVGNRWGITVAFAISHFHLCS